MLYSNTGVDLSKAKKLSDSLKNSIGSDNISSFAGFYEHPYIKEYVLTACCDGVGSKIISLLEHKMLDVIANDLIAMNLNDLVCTGAFPMFFLDYIATSKLNVEELSSFISILKKQLSEYNCALIGGETAEVPDIIAKNSFDVAGFAVGMVKKDRILSSKNVKIGDKIIGLCSSGPHANGFTLLRKLHSQGLLSDNDMQKCLKPTAIYVNEVLKHSEGGFIKACAHITGGGLYENLNRIIPDNLSFQLNTDKIPQQSIFSKIEKIIGAKEAYRVFNMGVGMALIANNESIDEMMTVCKAYSPFVLGEIIEKQA